MTSDSRDDTPQRRRPLEIHRDSSVDILALFAARRPEWMKDAACADYPAAWWFPDENAPRADAAKAINICRGCLVNEECLTYALDNNERFGIWGGERQRRRFDLVAGRKDAVVVEGYKVRNSLGKFIATAPHGTQSRYKRGCRCDDCRVGHRDATREAARRRREQEAS